MVKLVMPSGQGLAIVVRWREKKGDKGKGEGRGGNRRKKCVWRKGRANRQGLDLMAGIQVKRKINIVFVCTFVLGCWSSQRCWWWWSWWWKLKILHWLWVGKKEIDKKTTPTYFLVSLFCAFLVQQQQAMDNQDLSSKLEVLIVLVVCCGVPAVFP